MIHYSAHYGSPIISAFASEALRNLHTPVPLTGAHFHMTYASAVSTIFAATSAILGADAQGRGHIGGGVLDGDRIAVLGDDISTQVLGLLAAWSAGGVGTIVEPQDVTSFEWVDDLRPNVVLYPAGGSSIVAGLVNAHEWIPVSTSPNPLLVSFDIEASQKVEAKANPNKGYTTASDEEVVKMMRDLKWTDLDKPALFVASRTDAQSYGDDALVAQENIGEAEDVSFVQEGTASDVAPDATWQDTAVPGVPAEGEEVPFGDDEDVPFDNEDLLAPAACWAGPIPEAEGTTYTHRDIATFVLGVDPSPENETTANVEGLDQIPAVVALASLLKASPPVQLVAQ